MRRFTRLMFGRVLPVAAVLLWGATLVWGGRGLVAAMVTGCVAAYRLGEAEGLEQRRAQFDELREKAEALERQARDFWRRVGR